ncbi:MAG: sulfotransferase domain-containing protein [Pseudomonadota bacterium]|nr:sulfotransferase domain-containing protein [Pseudomonadota bacterium]
MDLPKVEHRYQNALMDSGRWANFLPRDSDIIISTPYKAGTTWIQRICALLIFQSVELDKPMSRISPWLDQLVYPIEDVIDRYEAQTHRRFMKTHTPLSGLPYFPNVTYLVCGRDPRDIFISMENHYANIDMPKFLDILARNNDAVDPPPSLPDDVNERFELWLTCGSFPWESDGFPFWSVFHHLQSFWLYRGLPNIHFIHYADLQADLAAEMRRIASILEIETDDNKWPDLVKAATFPEMKQRYEEMAPNMDQAIWHDGSKFFNKGTSGQWREILSAESVVSYDAAKQKKLEPSLAEWIDHN